MAPGHLFTWTNYVDFEAFENNFTLSAYATIVYNEFENYAFQSITTSPRGQWVKLIKTSPYLQLMGNLRDVYCEYFVENVWCYNSNLDGASYFMSWLASIQDKDAVLPP